MAVDDDIRKILAQAKAKTAPSAGYNPYGQSSVTQIDQFERDFRDRLVKEQMDRQNAVKRGIGSWIPEIPGFLADLAVDLPYNIAQRAAGRRDDNIKPLGFGEDVRRGVSQALGMAPASLGETGMSTPPDETNEDVTTALQRANPLMWGAAGNPVAIAKAAGKGVKALGPTAAKMAEDYLLKTGQMLPVMKPKGGNFLPDGTKAIEKLKLHRYAADDKKMYEAELEDLLRKEAEYPGRITERIALEKDMIAEMDRNIALNQFIDKQLTRYVKNEMATPEDPIRALAEKGTLHFDAPQVNASDALDAKRQLFAAGNNEKWGYGETRLAQNWEDAADMMITSTPAENFQNFGSSNMTGKPGWDWIDKVSPDTPLYGVSDPSTPYGRSVLGFPHLIDELSNATNPASGLPRELLLKPESLSRLSVPQAVERVAKINEWRADQIKNARLENMLKADVHKEYPEKGMRWVQLNKPGQFAEESDAMGHSVRGYEPTEGGGSSGYGLGGWDAIQSGKAKVYSLRDAKGEPHATIEVKSGYQRELTIDDMASMTPEEEAQIIALQRAKQPLPKIDVPGSIKQIKGKSNRAPNEEYLPYVQDFVRSGNWSDVNDLHNTGLISTKKGTLDYHQMPGLSGNASSLAHGRASAAGEIQPYMTKAELEAVLKKHAPEDIWSRPGQPMTEADITDPWEPEGMKRGGPVNQDAMQMAVWDKAAKKAKGGILGAAELAAKKLVRSRAGKTAEELSAIEKAELPTGMMDKAPSLQYTAGDRAAAGRKAAEFIASQVPVKASEALGQLREKGFTRTTTTQADRTRVGGGNIGGAAFPAISAVDPAYAGKAWGVMDAGTASRLTNLTTPDTAWTSMLGSATQLKTNPIVFDKLKRQFQASMKAGNLTPELEAKINQNLALTFGEGASIRDPSIWKQADSFDKRAALADIMMGQGIAPKKGGVALGGEKSGRGVIFKPTETLIKETEPSLLPPEHGGDVPTFAAGPRLFSLNKETSYRPDLHPGFPTMVHGEDLNFNVIPTPTEVYLPTWHKEFREKKPERFQGPWAQDIIERRKSGSYKLKGSEGPGYYDLALGLEGEGLPSQELSDAYIRHLIREGFKKGGRVQKKAAGGLTSDDLVLEERKL